MSWKLLSRWADRYNCCCLRASDRFSVQLYKLRRFLDRSSTDYTRTEPFLYLIWIYYSFMFNIHISTCFMHAVEINCLLGCRWKRCPLFYFVSEVILLYFSLHNQCYYSRLCHVIRPLLFLITTGVFCISCQSRLCEWIRPGRNSDW